ncbi:phosphatidate cytidylyltransferase [Veillonella dispar]|uniref:phosphatidate cytidylyltransferase n=1 Tax=Veillonella dispar TaxID=39778 RepID=UPI0034E982DA
MQIVFSDTPGVLKPNYKLQESMLNFSTSALADADVLLYVTDVIETPDKNNEFIQKVRQQSAPILLLINKIDLTDQEKLVKLVEEWKELLPQAEIIPISAATKFNVDYVMKRIKDLLPDSPPYFDKDQWTDKPARFFVNEIIREKIYMSLSMPFELYNWGTITLWLVLFTTWASDTFAYFAGRAFGKRKIVPSISPNKTLEGFIGGFIGCIITGAVFSYIVGIPWWMGIHVGMISGILAPLGDLFESKIKRLCNVKDSGTLLPGHGGVLDRFDSLLFAAPITLIYILLFSY